MRLRQVSAGVLGATAVALGAFGAHGLKDRLALNPEAAGWWQTATFYLLIHAVALGAIELPERDRSTSWPAHYWGWGSIIFSGTLYAMALGAPRWLGAITPVGGLLLITGWLLLAWAGRKES
ncbi:MAG: DUF423 domain-containing protein [Verrucomicrobia bacterium]|nr:DUF423 domain-containing protein [Verrucomicrobiota bacterium]NBS04813.1 DUF423 domain-containing protein [Verrucomicrobiota bacterium]NBY36421.1 DUF423 domain-containing protein [Verrucomicrobiota bacterium]